MGGLGSGQWYRWDKKTTCEEVKRIDIRFMKKMGWLRPGLRKLSWSCNDEPSGNISYQMNEDSMILDYRYRDNDGEWQPLKERVELNRTPCNFGGERLWFRCPHCHRRVAVLYCGGARFLCRHCYGLPYGSQQETYLDRMMRKARKIRERLGADGDLDMPIWEKPKGMHWRTFNRLVGEEEKVNIAIAEAIEYYLNGVSAL